MANEIEVDLILNRTRRKNDSNNTWYVLGDQVDDPELQEVIDNLNPPNVEALLKLEAVDG